MTDTTQPKWRGRWPVWPWLSLPLIAIVAVLDHVTGPDLAFSIFYLAPIAVAAWWGGRRPGVFASVLAAGVWLGVDMASPHYANPAVIWWNAAVRLGFYLLVSLLLTAQRSHRTTLEGAVHQRTRALEEALDSLQVEVRQRLSTEEALRRAEGEVLQAAEREQRRIGQDLHDSIQSSLAGLRMLVDSLRSRDGRFPPDLDERLGKISDVLAETIRQTRGLAASCCPVDLQGQGLTLALEKLAATTRSVFRMPCEFRQELDLPWADEAKASHLYYIAREAVGNVLKHARASRITIAMGRRQDRLVLSIEDDGIGLPSGAGRATGMGLRTMASRASILGADLDIRPRVEGGTVVECSLPWQSIAAPEASPHETRA